jgi:hypothetical protein
MESFKIKDILVEHSNALRALLRASRAEGKEADAHVRTAVSHVKLLLKAFGNHDPSDVPPQTEALAKKSITYLESGEVDEARAVLLEMGRSFDDFLKN